LKKTTGWRKSGHEKAGRPTLNVPRNKRTTETKDAVGSEKLMAEKHARRRVKTLQVRTKYVEKKKKGPQSEWPLTRGITKEVGKGPRSQNNLIGKYIKKSDVGLFQKGGRREHPPSSSKGSTVNRSAIQRKGPQEPHRKAGKTFKTWGKKGLDDEKKKTGRGKRRRSGGKEAAQKRGD